MIEKSIENEKFILNVNYNEKLKKFENVSYTEKKLNKLEKKILKEAYFLFDKCSVQELYEHLIIRIENKLRDYNSVNYSGILFPENISEEYMYFQNFFRDFLKPFLKNDLNTKINFQAIKPNKEWSNLNNDQKKNKIYDQTKKYTNLLNKLTNELKIIKIINNTDIYIELLKMNDIGSKNKFCLNLEIYLKKNIDESLIVYLETATDRNKIRRLTL